MSNTPNLDLPYIAAAQAQKHVTHNEAIRRLDALIQLSVADRDLSAPPAAPADGARYIVAANATGTWAGQEGRVAAWQDGAWAFLTPRAGWLAWVADETVLLSHNGSDWMEAGAQVNPAPLVGVNATADSTNRLSVSSPASLFNHEGAGHQLKINKAQDVETASLLYQTGWSGRAEMGTAGDDDFHIKVSADGSVWKEALVIDRSSGAVFLPNTASPGGGAQELGGAWRSTRDPNVGWITHPGASLTSVAAATAAVFAPLRIGAAGQYSKMSVTCHAAAAGQSVRMALYGSATDRLVGMLEADFGSADCSAAGVKTAQIAPVTLPAGLYYAVVQASSPALTFRGGYSAIHTGAGVLQNIIFAAGIGRIVYLGMNDPWPLDMSGFAIGTGFEQVQLLGSYFCPCVMLS